MKKILICRHGKSSWDDPYLSDHTRPLAPRGLRNSKEMAERLSYQEILPDMILTSDAKRAMDTAYITAEVLGLKKELINRQGILFHASASTLMEIIKGLQPEINTVFIFGHNPGLNDLIWQLGGEIENLPTAGQYGFVFNVKNWGEITNEDAKFWYYDYPKNKG